MTRRPALRLFELYEQRMYRVAYAILHDEGQAEDAVMAAFEGIAHTGKAPRSPASKEAERLAFASVRNAAIDQDPAEGQLHVQSYDMAQDPVNVRRVAVQMDDGAAYTVLDKASNLDNTLAACGFDTSLAVAFNRLVDPAHVVSVEVDVTGVQNMDDMRDADGNWPDDASWPVRTVTYSRS